jgi:preprotein translocase subunit SecA
MFQALTASIQADFVRYIYRVEFVRHDEEPQQQAAQPARMHDNRAEVEQAGGQRAPSGGGAGTANANQAVSDKVPRNAPCPCGSGKKYKKCHGAAA